MKLLVLFRLHICNVVSQKTVGLFKTNFLSSAKKVPSTMNHLMQHFPKGHFVLNYVQLFFYLSKGLLGYVVWGQFYIRVEVISMVGNLEMKRFPLFSKDKNNGILPAFSHHKWISACFLTNKNNEVKYKKKTKISNSLRSNENWLSIRALLCYFSTNHSGFNCRSNHPKCSSRFENNNPV